MVARMKPLLVAAVERKIADGWRLRRGTTCSESRRACCPIGALEPRGSYALEDGYGLPTGWAGALEDGFDGDTRSLLAFQYPDAAALGAWLYATYARGEAA